jgi:ATP/maltotriose-dependent transcriptional regulator MalT/DNA-binding SARP family transcriptional activator
MAGTAAAGRSHGPTMLERPQLERRLDEAFGKRLTLVVAGAGFGKTTLLASWADDLDAVWYQVRETDRAVIWLARGLLSALGRRVSGLPGELSAALEAGGGAPEAEREWAATFAGLLCDALEELLAHDVMLVLDDVHELDSASASTRLLETLCRQAPATLHLVLASREELPFATGRLRGQGQVLELAASELAFSLDEITTLLQGIAAEGARDLAADLLESTGGWPAAVRLALEALRESGPDGRAATVKRLRRPEGPVFAYLAEEVFAREGAPLRRFLARVVHLERFTQELCEAIGASPAPRTLVELARRGLVQEETAAEGWFTIHALVREFALRSWPLSAEESRRLHSVAAAWLVGRGELEGAVRLLAADADPDAITRLLTERGEEILTQIGAGRVVELAELLPDDRYDRSVDEVVGDALTVLGDSTRALERYRRSAAGASTLPTRLAWRIGTTHYFRGEIDEALRVFELAGTVEGELADDAQLLAATANAYRLQGDVEAARGAATRALEAAVAAGDDRALAAAHNAVGNVAELEGDGPQAEAHFRQALEPAERARDITLVSRLRVNLSSQLCVAGQYEEVLAELDVALPLAELAGFDFVIAYGLPFRAFARFALGQPEQAIADYKASISLYRRLGNPTWASIPLAGLGDTYREIGSFALARMAYEEAVAVSEAAGDVQGLVPALSGLARVLVTDDLEQAGELAGRAATLSSGWGHVAALLAAGWVTLARGDRDGAHGWARAAHDAAREWRDRAGLAEAIELDVLSSPDPRAERPRLDEALAIWREIANLPGQTRCELAGARLGRAAADVERAERKLRRLGIRVEEPHAAGLLAALPPESPPAVGVRSLGGFYVLRDGEPIPADEWQSKKARDLLKLLVAYRCRPVPRDALMEALWPGQDPHDVASRLSVVASIVRSILDPGKRFEAQHFLASDRETVSLVEKHVSVDVETFIAEAQAGLALGGEAGERLEYAASLYAGDFLEDDAYTDWAVPLREQARTLFIDTLRALAEQSAVSGDHDRAVRYLLRILERDPFDERAHLGLVTALQQAGRQGDARRQFSRYTARMDEIGVEAAPYPAAARSGPP